MQKIVKHEQLLLDFEAVKGNPEKKKKNLMVFNLSMAQQKYEQSLEIYIFCYK